MTLASVRTCGGCGAVVDAVAISPTCPNVGDGGDHVLMRELDDTRLPFDLRGDPAWHDRPFLRWRHRLHAWHLAAAGGWSDEAFIGLVCRLEEAIARIDRRFVVTPLVRADDLAAMLTREAPIFIKDETGNVAGSHKARHLFGTLLALEVLGVDRAQPLAIASCGNAALAAAVLANAAERPLTVFVPTDAERYIVRRLVQLGAKVVTCERRDGVSGDPTVHALREALGRGAISFSCQGSDNGLAIEGGETLGWELANQLAQDGDRVDRVFIQVGGGALGSAVARGLLQARAEGMMAATPKIHAVQIRQVAPLSRAYEHLARRLAEAIGFDELEPACGSRREWHGFAGRRADRLRRGFTNPSFQAMMDDAVRHRSDYMWSWETMGPSVAHGIRDDETYDWWALTRAMLETGGYPIVVDEAEIVAAHALGTNTTAIRADETGTASLAGLLDLALCGALPSTQSCLVFFTGQSHPLVP